ncbi:hypothetical protein ACVWZB_004742 [Paenibacillus polymyxa]
MNSASARSVIESFKKNADEWPITTFQSQCPHCSEVLIRFEIDESSNQKIITLPDCPTLQGDAIYQDGDLIPLDESQRFESSNRFMAELQQGKCPACEEYFWTVFFYYASRAVCNEEIQGEGILMIDGDIESTSVKYYKVGNDTPCYKIEYEDVHLEGDSDDGSLTINVYMIGPLKMEGVNNLNGRQGVSACRNNLIWEYAAEIVTLLGRMKR